jgi:hypothetical protein
LARKAKANTTATAAKPVDCHKWGKSGLGEIGGRKSGQ